MGGAMTDGVETHASETSALATDGEDIHVHRPKPLHGPREILTEVGVIVIGIVIALVLKEGGEVCTTVEPPAKAARRCGRKSSRISPS